MHRKDCTNGLATGQLQCNVLCHRTCACSNLSELSTQSILKELRVTGSIPQPASRIRCLPRFIFQVNIAYHSTRKPPSHASNDPQTSFCPATSRLASLSKLCAWISGQTWLAGAKFRGNWRLGEDRKLCSCQEWL